jgi:alpha-glucosidase
MSIDGTPVLNPLWYLYPSDSTTWPIEHQFFFGNAILVSPVTGDDATSVNIYLPKDTFYDFNTLAPVQGEGDFVFLPDVNFTTIPVHIRSGVVLPLRTESAMTTAELRTKDFELIVAQNANGTATGSLYLDDGVSLVQKSVTTAQFQFSAHSKLTVSGHFGFNTGVNFARVKVLNAATKPKEVKLNGKNISLKDVQFDGKNKVLTVSLDLPMTAGFTLEFH